jgi:tubulin--tyrosine ligase-like protein 12
LWIVKAPDLARSLDQTISGELVSLLRLSTSNGPKLISEYISRPVTLRQRKFDLRFVVLVTGLRPCLELFIYDKFRVRCAAEPYRLEDFGNFARHWTAMNHSANSASGEVSADRRMKVNCKEFAAEINDEATWRMERRRQKEKAMHQHNHHHHHHQKPEDITPALAAPPTPVDVWTPTYNQIKRMMKELFSCFETVGGEEVSRRTHSRFRAMYGVDVLLRDRTDDDDEETWKKDGYDPLLLEITYSPDVSQECEDEPKFFEGVFCTLFLDQPRLFSRI